jgi:hypothetical protein
MANPPSIKRRKWKEVYRDAFATKGETSDKDARPFPFPHVLWIAAVADSCLWFAFAMFLGWALVAIPFLPWQAPMISIYFVATVSFALSFATAKNRREAMEFDEGGLNYLTAGLAYILNRLSRAPRIPTEHDRRRWRVADVLSIYTWVLGLLFGSFAALLALLASRGWVVEISGKNDIDETGAYFATLQYLVWTALDVVPLLEIPKTLNWEKLSHPITDPLSGFLLLGFKLLLIIPVTKFVVFLFKQAFTDAPAPPVVRSS